MAQKKANWIDFDAGALLHGQTMEQLTTDLWQMILLVTAGQLKTKNEEHGYRETAIFKDGVIM